MKALRLAADAAAIRAAQLKAFTATLAADTTEGEIETLEWKALTAANEKAAWNLAKKCAAL